MNKHVKNGRNGKSKKSVLSEVPKKMRSQLVDRRLGTKQLMIGAGMFVILTALLAIDINVVTAQYMIEPISWQKFVGIALLVFGVLVLSALYLYQFRPYMYERPSLLLLLGLITITVPVFAKVLAVYPASISPAWGYLVPVSFAALIVTVLFDPYLAIMIVVSTSIFSGYVMGSSFAFTAAGLFGGAIAIYAAWGVTERTELARAGIVTGVGLGFFCMTLGLIEYNVTTGLLFGLAGLVNGVFSTVFALGLLPFVEKHFGIVTPMRLLSLANPKQPLLRMMMAEAPGTYSHSIVVGSLAEAAADAIGADSLLVRVGAYYHDIGKMKRPGFFVENQVRAGNKHEKINPQLSCLVITAHVREGADMARENDLPQPIIELISEHHGTSLVAYFYHQAKNGALGKNVCEEGFRYPGVRPHSRESAILMLADATEAAAKTIRKPSQARFEELTKKLVRDRLEDGQLDECDLTLADVTKIIRSFTQTLIGIYHPRVEYPDDKTDRMRSRGRRVLGSQL